MTDRLWDRSDEWGSYAACDSKPDFIIDPETLGPERVAAVKKTCAGCLVRPECIVGNAAPVIAPSSLKIKGNSTPVTYPSCSIWVAGEWLPDRDSAQSRAVLEGIKDELNASLPYEYATRPLGML
jgi:hypothetical protein